MQKLFKTAVLVCVLLSSASFVQARRYYDAAIGRWLIPDPALQEREPEWLAKNGYYSVSPYVYVFNNPLRFIDPNGEEVYINEQGYINQDATVFDPDDPSVYRDLGDKGLMYVGEIGGDIYVESVFENLLNKNIDLASDLWNPFTFIDLVKTGGEWDLKNNQKTIWGLGNETQGTIFHFNNFLMKAQDIGNYHFGTIGKAFGSPENVLLWGAGMYQRYSKMSKLEWQKGIFTPPFGDDPGDQYWIKQGFIYYNQKHK